MSQKPSNASDSESNTSKIVLKPEISKISCTVEFKEQTRKTPLEISSPWRS